jgi:hypothetical protein
LTLALGLGKHKIILEHLEVPENKEVFKKEDEVYIHQNITLYTIKIFNLIYQLSLNKGEMASLVY